MGISNQPFLMSYEDPSSPQYIHLASLVSKQVRRHSIMGAVLLTPVRVCSVSLAHTMSILRPFCLSAETDLLQKFSAGKVL